MAITSTIYGNFPVKVSNKEIDYDTDNIKVMLCNSSYVPDQDTDIYKNQVTNEISSAGYVAGGELVTGKSVTYLSKVTTYLASNTDWASLTGTFRYAVIYCDTGNPNTSALIKYVDFGTDVTITSSHFTIVWDSGKIVTFTLP